MPISIKPSSPQAEEHKRQDTQDGSCREASTRSFDSLAQLPRCQVGLPADLGLKPLYTSYMAVPGWIRDAPEPVDGRELKGRDVG
jgi:hypothetical protein